MEVIWEVHACIGSRPLIRLPVLQGSKNESTFTLFLSLDLKELLCGCYWERFLLRKRWNCDIFQFILKSIPLFSVCSHLKMTDFDKMWLRVQAYNINAKISQKLQVQPISFFTRAESAWAEDYFLKISLRLKPSFYDFWGWILQEKT